MSFLISLLPQAINVGVDPECQLLESVLAVTGEIQCLQLIQETCFEHQEILKSFTDFFFSAVSELKFAGPSLHFFETFMGWVE